MSDVDYNSPDKNSSDDEIEESKEGNEETEDSSYDGSEQMFEYNPTGDIGNIFVDENDDDGEEPLFP